MPYTIKKSDGSTLIILRDDIINVDTTSIPLIGKNVNDYGEYYNETVVALLENFASTQQPDFPLIGQLWYDNSAGLMKVYNNQGFFETLAPNISSASVPSLPRTGDLWVDTTNDQLKFKSTSEDFILAGPIYTKSQGKAGFEVIIVADTNGDPHNVTAIYSNNVIIAAISDESFILRDPSKLNGIPTIQPGINANDSLSIPAKFIGNATNASVADLAYNVAGSLSLDSIPPIFLTNYANNGSNNPRDVTTGTLHVANNTGFTVGADANILLDVSGAFPSLVGNIKHDIVDSPLRIQGKNSGISYFTALHIDSENVRVGILTESPQSDLDINGDTIIQGRVTALSTVTVNTLQVNDKVIELNYSSEPTTDLIASGGGIILHGDTDHSLTWTTDNNKSWEVNDNFNLLNSDSSYKIGGQTVITSSTLGISIVSAPGINSLGILGLLTVTNILLSGSTISTIDFDTDLILNPNGDGNINVSNHKISNLTTCTSALDAANKSYVDNTLFQFASRFSFTVDETMMVDPPVSIIALLNSMFPIVNDDIEYSYLDIPNGSRSRILCATTGVTVPLTNATMSKSFITVDKGGITNSQSVLQDVNALTTATTAILSTSYIVREFSVVGGAWTYVGVI